MSVLSCIDEKNEEWAGNLTFIKIRTNLFSPIAVAAILKFDDMLRWQTCG
jgi:hypothetical protein